MSVADTNNGELTMVWRKMRVNHSNAIARRLVFLATTDREEQNPTDPVKYNHTLVCGHAISGRWEDDNLTRIKEYTFSVPELFWNWFFKQCSREYTTWLFGHDIMRQLRLCELRELFDSAIVQVDLPRGKRREDDNSPDKPHGQGFTCIDDPPTIIGLRHCSSASRFVIVDLLNWFDVPLERLADYAGLSTLLSDNQNAGSKQSYDTSRCSCTIVGRGVIGLLRYVRENNLGMFRYTAASQALGAFRHRFMFHTIWSHDERTVKQLERTAYFAGQTEVFRYGKIRERVHLFDTCALFPSVMIGNIYPRELSKWELRDTFTVEQPPMQMEQAIATVRVATDTLTLPVRLNGKPCYAKGSFVTILAGPELLLAVRHGAITGWGTWAEYKCDRLFDLFVRELWHLRLHFRDNGNPLFEQLTKTLMNSLYGKFGQMTPEWVDRPELIPPDSCCSWTVASIADKTLKHFRSIGMLCQEQVAREEKDGNFPAISAFVTSYARCRMMELREIAGQRNVYYQGVDSLIVNDQGKIQLDGCGEVHPLSLGKLRHEITADECDLQAKGVYKIGDKVVMVGRNANFQKLGDWRWAERQYNGMPSFFRPGGQDTVESRTVSKQLLADVSRREIDELGYATPVTLSESVNW